ncbi:GNAT family N-acetyltransferase [Nocardiopsis sp. NPDC006198]|uniref:GNAT family N-acetyltransferase n=1 Tax=Nocardiopsis sp. NPDC006198 TaxID=3154472 RepID=UPI0033A0EA76
MERQEGAPAPDPRGSGVDIGPMAVEHLPAVLDLGHRVYETSALPYTSWSLTAAAGHLDSPRSSCRVALSGTRVVGFVLGSMGFEHRDDWGYMEWIAVDPGLRGHGIAGRLVRECCAGLEALGASRILTDVETGNTASLALMRGSGFSENTTVMYLERRVGPER